MPFKKTKTWILVADGARGRIFVSQGWGKGLKPALDYQFAASHAPMREFVSDKQGRTFDRAGQGRHAMEPAVDPRRYEKLAFARDLARVLDEAAVRGEFERLVLVAPPQALGDIRAALHKNTLKKVTAELDKDLTHLADHELGKYLDRVMPV